MIEQRARKSLIAIILFTAVASAGLLSRAGAQTAPPGKSAAPAKKASGAATPAAAGGDWPELRGPNRDGLSPEKNLPEKWSPKGENLVWRAPFGGISGPVVFGDRVYLQNTIGRGAEMQERVLAIDANTGKLLWDYRINLNHSDVPPHRAAWATPSVDVTTGTVYVFAANGTLVALTAAGKPIWTRYLTEEFGLITTHGGRTVSPLIDEDLVIVSGITFDWGEHARGAHRFVAFDKKTGHCVWFSSPGGRPYDTTYAPAVVKEVNGMRLLIAGASDGHVHALKVRTGESVWKYEVSKRGLNTGVIFAGGRAIITHSEENMDTSEMGYRSALDPALTGTITDKQTQWLHYGFLGGFASPVTDGTRYYQVDNGALLGAFEVATGKLLWQQKLGTIQKANLVMADGKIYVGTENGKFFILRPRVDGADILSEVLLGTEQEPEPVTSGAAISRGRIYFASEEALYAIGKKGTRVPPARLAAPKKPAPATGEATYVQVTPTELALKPGEKVKFTARAFNAKGELVPAAAATWSLEQLGGAIQPDGSFAASNEAKAYAGKVVAKIGGLSGAARVRVIPPLPLSDDFSGHAVGSLPAHWVNATGKYAVKELDGQKVLTKLADNQFSFIKRARAYIGLREWSDYTVECDVRAATRRRQTGDGGVVAQGYALILFGNSQKLELMSWQPETQRSKTVDFAWKPDTWYRLKLRVENLPDGRVRALGKAWAVGEPEPEKWTIERVDSAALAIKRGSPGIYGDAPFEVYFDNLKVTPNK